MWHHHHQLDGQQQAEDALAEDALKEELKLLNDLPMATFFRTLVNVLLLLLLCGMAGRGEHF